jgi:hypothetical protein
MLKNDNPVLKMSALNQLGKMFKIFIWPTYVYIQEKINQLINYRLSILITQYVAAKILLKE